LIFGIAADHLLLGQLEQLAGLNKSGGLDTFCDGVGPARGAMALKHHRSTLKLSVNAQRSTLNDKRSMLNAQRTGANLVFDRRHSAFQAPVHEVGNAPTQLWRQERHAYGTSMWQPLETEAAGANCLQEQAQDGHADEDLHFGRLSRVEPWG
jgi:hypothetical protein